VQLEIVDTVYLIAYLRPSDPLHDEAVNVLSGLGKARRISEASLIELDLLMKVRGFTPIERAKTWRLLEKIIPPDALEPLTSRDYTVAAILADKYELDYFDSLIAAQCIVRKAKPLTTDERLAKAASESAGELLRGV